MDSFANATFDEIEIGRSLAVSRTISRTDIESLAFVSGDIDEAHLDQESGPGRVPSAESVACAVVHPCGRDSLLGPIEAARDGTGDLVDLRQSLRPPVA